MSETLPAAAGPHSTARPGPRLWVERLALTDFRNYAHAVLETGSAPVVLLGANGAGKTNLLEAVSLLGPGQGMRRAAYVDLVHTAGPGGWAVAGRVHTSLGTVEIGTGQQPGAGGPRAGRLVRLDGESHAGTGILADYVEVVWVTPAMNGLFTGPAGDRRRFLDRLILCFDPSYRTRAGRFERAMQQRNRLLADGSRDRVQLDGLEMVMAESGVAIAAARAEVVTALAATIGEARAAEPDSPFPWSQIALDGALEHDLAHRSAIDVEDGYRSTLARARERDRAAGRTLDGPHRSDFIVGHGPKGMPARLGSTGEQKALLLGLVLAHARLVRERRDGVAPLLLLDEVAAHLDEARRSALFDAIIALGAQAWMTGTDERSFSGLVGRGDFLHVRDGIVTR